MAAHPHPSPLSVFISYNSVDFEGADRVERLLPESVTVLRDRDVLPPGQPIRERLGECMNACDLALVVFGPHGAGSYQAGEVAVLLHRRGSDPDFRVIPVWLRGAPLNEASPAVQELHQLSGFRADRFRPDDEEAELRVFLRRAVAEGMPRATLGRSDVRALEVFSQLLLGQPTSMPGEERIPLLCEEDVLSHAVGDVEECVLLLGPPGSGKTALLSAAGARAQAAGLRVVALKADAIAATVQTERDLAAEVGLAAPTTVSDAIAAMAKEGPVLLLVDQLDAVADLQVRHVGRLHTLLTVIDFATGTPGVRIIASCRTHDFHHDRRFRALRPARAVTVEPLPWAPVANALERRGFASGSFGEPRRDVLRVPQHLRLFLDLARPGGGPPEVALDALVEELWRERVSPWPARASLLRVIAEHMAESEELWIAASRMEDEHALAIEALCRDGVLCRSADGRRIGFSHQSLFDHARGRMFAGGASFADYVLRRQDSVHIRREIWWVLHYLRGVDRSRYHRELQRMWNAPDLRRFHRRMIEELLGSLPDPDDVEACLLLPLLEPRRSGALSHVIGSPGWFSRLEGGLLRDLMCAPVAESGVAAEVLVAAMRFAPARVVDLLRCYWRRDAETKAALLWVLERSRHWTEETVGLAAAAFDAVGPDDWRVGLSIKRACQVDAALALPLVESYLDLKVQLLDVEAPDEPHDLRHHVKMRSVAVGAVSTGGRLSDVRSAASREPRRYGPVLLRYLEACALRLHAGASFDHGDGELIEDLLSDALQERHLAEAPDLALAFRDAVDALAQPDAEVVLSMARSVERHELLSMQIVAAWCYRALAPVDPEVVVEWIAADPRRLDLAKRDGARDWSAQLVEAVAHSGDAAALCRLVGLIRAWVPPRDGDDDPDLRRMLLREARVRRFQLLRAIPDAQRAPDVVAELRVEDRAIPRAEAEPVFSVFGAVPPRMNATQMERASIADIVKLLQRETAGRGSPCTRYLALRDDDLRVTHQQVEAFAKVSPEKALTLIHRLSWERGAASVLRAASGIARSDADASLRESAARWVADGACSDDERADVLVAFVAAARRHDEKAPAWLIDWHLRWLATCRVPGGGDQEPRPSQEGSVLWGHQPHFSISGPLHFALWSLGDYFAHRANADECDRWLGVLAGCAAQAADASGSESLFAPLAGVLRVATPASVASFFERIARDAPQHLATAAGARALAWCIAFDHASGTQLIGWTHVFRTSQWDRAKQATGELLGLRRLRGPEDGSVSVLVEALVAAKASSGAVVEARAGLAHAAARFVMQPGPAGLRAQELFGALVACAEPQVARAAASVFLLAERPKGGRVARMILSLLLAHESFLLAASAHQVVDALPDLVVEMPVETVEVASRLVKRALSDGELRGELGLCDEALDNVAWTALALPGCQRAAMDLFEGLYDLQLPSIVRTTRDIEARPRPTD